MNKKQKKGSNLSSLCEIKSEIHEGSFMKGVDKIVLNNDSKPSLSHAWFKNDHLYATDRHIAIKIHLGFLGLHNSEYEAFNNKSFNYQALKELSRITKDQEWYVSDLGVIIPDTKIILFSNDDYKFLDIDAIIPENTEPISFLSINGDFLKTIQDVYKNLGGERGGLLMEFSGEKKAIKLLGNGHEGFEAVISPIIY